MRTVGVLLLLACARAPIVDPYLEPEPALRVDSANFALAGPRAVTVLGDEDLALRLGTELENRGFSVSRGVPGVTSKVTTTYVVHVEGRCEAAERVLHAEVFETRTNQSLVAANLGYPDACPDAFMREFAALLDARWKRPVPPAATSDL